MANTEKIDCLLLEIRELEKTVASMRDADVLPVSFFSNTFDLTHKILHELQKIESDQLTPKPIPETTSVAAEKGTTYLHDILEKNKLSDFRKAFSLNDHFFFRKELFGGDEDYMNNSISDLNDIHSYEESIDYLNNILKWNIEDAKVASFVRLVEKRFR